MNDLPDLSGIKPILLRTTDEAPAQLAVQRACKDCEASVKEGNDRVCRYRPPTSFLFALPAPAMPGLGGPGTQFKAFSNYPIVRDDAWCIEGFRPRKQ